MKKGLILGLMVLMTMVATPAAQATAAPDATATYYFTSQHCTGGCGPFPDGSSYGTVTLAQFGTDANAVTFVTVHLLAPLEFVSTGAGDNQDFLFNATGVVVGDITVNQNAPFPLVATTGSYTHGGAGDFAFGITGDTGLPGDQQNGAPGRFNSDIIFHVASASIADLTQPNADGNIFAADIFSNNLGGALGNGNTGLVDVTGTAVPEPVTMLLLGSGLVGLWGARRKVKK